MAMSMDMGGEFALTPPGPELPRTYNSFFIILGIAVAIIGSWTALSFTENFVQSRLQLNTLHRGNTALTLGAASFTIAVNTVWLMHFVNTSSVSVNGFPVRFDLTEVILSLIYILGATVVAFLLYCTHSKGLISMDAVTQQSSPFIRLYYSRPADTESWGAHLKHLLAQARAALSWRLIFAGSIVGTGVYAMHHSGVHAGRARYRLTFNPIWIASSVPVGVIAGSVLLLVLFTAHGWKRRIPASVILGLAVNAVHWHGYAAASFSELPAEQWDPYQWAGSVLVDAKVATVIVLLLSSLIRFGLMGLISVAAD